MARTLVLVAKDNGAANVIKPVIWVARELGFNTLVVAEGHAGKRLAEAGNVMEFQGTVDFERLPFTFDCDEFLKYHKPDAVITGISGPIHLEQEMGLAANALDIPLIVINDFWGVFTRGSAKPDVVCVLDEFDAELAKQRGAKRVVISGNGGAVEVLIPHVSSLKHELEFVRGQVGGPVYCYIGGSEINTDAELMLVIECLKDRSGCLIARFHPNHVNLSHPKGGTWGDHWKGMLEVLGERSVTILSKTKTDEIAVLSDLVISGFSTVLTTAVYNKVPIVLSRTPETMKDFFGCTKGLEEIPHIRLGAPVFSEPTDLQKFITDQPAGLREKFIPFDPRKVIEAVELLLAERATV